MEWSLKPPSSYRRRNFPNSFPCFRMLFLIRIIYTNPNLFHKLHVWIQGTAASHIEELQARIVHAVLIYHIYESAFQRLACADLSESYMFLSVVSELLNALVERRAVCIEFQVCFCPLGIIKLFIRFGAVTTIAASEQFQRRSDIEFSVGISSIGNIYRNCKELSVYFLATVFIDIPCRFSIRITSMWL